MISIQERACSGPVGKKNLFPAAGLTRRVVNNKTIVGASLHKSSFNRNETQKGVNTRIIDFFPVASFGGNGNNGSGKRKIRVASGGDNGRGDDKNEDKDKLYTHEEILEILKKTNTVLPKDMLDVAVKYGLRKSILDTFLSLKDKFFIGFLLRSVPFLRDRILADNMFLFKIAAEVLIDSGCATVAEYRKRGDEFWNEIDFYLSDLAVGLVMDVALVSLMAPVAVLGGASQVAAASGLKKFLASVPSAVFAPNSAAVAYSPANRAACIVVKFFEYAMAGLTCGILGQGVANSLMLLKRKLRGSSEHDKPVPPLLKTALVWSLFMGVSSNLRYQAVFGLERLVELTVARRVPQVGYAATIALRFANNVVGGENFIDMARWAGVQ